MEPTLDQSKISAAADLGLSFALTNCDRLLRNAADFVALLDRDPKWTDADVDNVQTQLISRLYARVSSVEKRHVAAE